jgi:hypothetical protein
MSSSAWWEESIDHSDQLTVDLVLAQKGIRAGFVKLGV